MQDNAEDIDLEYLSEDFPKLLNSMKGATDRIKGISTSLRTFSRADTDKGVGKGTGLGLAIARVGDGGHSRCRFPTPKWSDVTPDL